MGDTKKYVVKVISIPCIREEIKRVHVSTLGKQFNLAKEIIRRGRGEVDLLIGIDHAYLLTAPTKQVDHLVARRSPLGCVIIGSTPGDLNSAAVLHVKFSTPVDLSDFWTSEWMGVKIDPCVCDASKLHQIDREGKVISEESDRKIGDQWMIPYPWKRDLKELPDNKEQEIRRLETTERRLLKNPNDAIIYNEKMLEMEEMNFASKLKEVDINEYKGPVHYISHHAVLRPDSASTAVGIFFNSSSSYQGHRLSDY